MLVELKSGETLNGHLLNCDTWMNLTLKDVIQTSPDGETFMKVPEYYVRGNLIKYLRVPDELIDQIKEQNQLRQENRNNYNRNNHQGGGNFRGGRGGNRGGRGGRGGYKHSHQNNNYNNRDRDNNNYNNNNQNQSQGQGQNPQGNNRPRY